MRSPQFYAGVVRAMLTFSILCHLVGFSAPGWLCLKKIKMVGSYAYKETEKSESYGVWYALRCGSHETGATGCIPENYYTTESIYGEDRLTYNPGKSTILHWQLQTTAALVACIFGTVFVHMQRNLLLQYRPGQPPPSKTKYVLALICCTVSGSLLSWPVTQYIRVNQSYQRIWAFGITISIPYALIAAGVGAFLNWVSVLMLLIIFCKGMCLADSNQQVIMQPATQTQMIPLMPVQNAPAHTGYADPMNPMYQPPQPYHIVSGGYHSGSSQPPPGHQYSYQPPMYPIDKTRTDGQYYPPTQQYPQYQYEPQNKDDNTYWQQSMPT